MADHPFDDVAVEAAIKAFLDEGGMWASDFQKMNAALTAAFKSMKDRGMARVEQKALLRIGDNMPYEGPVTIIRHKENGA